MKAADMNFGTVTCSMDTLSIKPKGDNYGLKILASLYVKTSVSKCLLDHYDSILHISDVGYVAV